MQKFIYRVRDAGRLSTQARACRARRQKQIAATPAAAMHITLARRESRKLQQEINTLRLQALTDSLTNIPNQRAYDQAISQTLARARRAAERSSAPTSVVALLLTDGDKLSEVNNTCGHAAGDVHIREYANVLRANLRTGDQLFRVGRGDEFAIIADCRSEADAFQLAEKLRRAVEQHLFTYRRTTCSIGIALAPCDGADPMTLFKSADKSLYACKETGRNRVCRLGLTPA